MESHFLNDTHEAIHCTHGSLTSRWSWIIQAILATLAFACLLGKMNQMIFYSYLGHCLAYKLIEYFFRPQLRDSVSHLIIGVHG